MAHLAYTGEYSDDWESLRWQVYARADWRCEHCGMAFWPGTTRAMSATRVTGEPMVLTVHHLTGDKSDNRHENLLACCQACHLHIQAVWRPGGVLPAHWEQPPRWISKRGLPYEPNGQLSLWSRMRYTYLGDALTEPRLVGMQCDPIRRPDGHCIISVKMATALVEDGVGRKYVVPRRRLRLNNKRSL